MIGFSFLVAGLLWLVAAAWLSSRIPHWLSIQKHRTPLSVALFPVIVLLPFLDHIIGMRQFHKLCEEQTRLRLTPNAENTSRAREEGAGVSVVTGFPIEITRLRMNFVDLETGSQIASYDILRTPGGRIGGLVQMGGKYECSVGDPSHVDRKKYLDLRVQTKLAPGGSK